MYCKNCGKQIADQALFCVHCGCTTDAPSAYNAPVVPEKTTNHYAIAGFVMTMIGLFFGSGTYEVIPVLGLIFSIVGLVKSKSCGSGRGLSIAGIVISLLSIILCIVLIIFVIPALFAFLAGLGSGMGSGY